MGTKEDVKKVGKCREVGRGCAFSPLLVLSLLLLLLDLATSSHAVEAEKGNARRRLDLEKKIVLVLLSIIYDCGCLLQ